MNALEKKFKEEVLLHKEEISKAYDKAVALSEKYGIPFGSYVPKSFHKKFKGYEVEDGEGYDDWVGISASFVNRTCAMDREWLSSTVECEFGDY